MKNKEIIQPFIQHLENIQLRLIELQNKLSEKFYINEVFDGLDEIISDINKMTRINEK